MKKQVAVLLIMAACVSCVSNPPNYESMSAGRMCSLGRSIGGGSLEPAAKRQLESRSVFSDREWHAITDRKIFVGMSEDALVCSWTIMEPGLSIPGLLGAQGGGNPVTGGNGQVNPKEGDWGIRKIYSWSIKYPYQKEEEADFRLGKLYVFVENGVVVNYGHLEFESISEGIHKIDDLYNHDFKPRGFWGAYFQQEHFDFSLLKPPPRDAWYVYRESEDRNVG